MKRIRIGFVLGNNATAKTLVQLSDNLTKCKAVLQTFSTVPQFVYGYCTERLPVGCHAKIVFPLRKTPLGLIKRSVFAFAIACLVLQV